MKGTSQDPLLHDQMASSHVQKGLEQIWGRCVSYVDCTLPDNVLRGQGTFPASSSFDNLQFFTRAERGFVQTFRLNRALCFACSAVSAPFNSSVPARLQQAVGLRIDCKSKSLRVL